MLLQTCERNSVDDWDNRRGGFEYIVNVPMLSTENAHL